MQYTAGQAAQATGKNIATITRAIKSGKISAQKDAAGAWRIEASELHRVFSINAQDLREPKMQNDASPLQDQSKNQTAALEQALATLRERVAAQSELLDERAGQISDLKEDRDRWRQQASNLLTNLQSKEHYDAATTRRRRWWPF